MRNFEIDFQDDLLFELKYAHATRFDKNRVRYFEDFHASHDISHLISEGNSCK